MLTRLIYAVRPGLRRLVAYRGNCRYGELVGFLLYVNIFLEPIEKINALMEIYPKGIAGFKRYLRADGYGA